MTTPCLSVRVEVAQKCVSADKKAVSRRKRGIAQCIFGRAASISVQWTLSQGESAKTCRLQSRF